MLKSTLYTIILLLCWMNTQSQTISIKGQVKDSETLEPLEFCSIVLLSTTAQTYTNAEGLFSLELSNNQQEIAFVFSYSDYHSDTLVLNDPQKFYSILLVPQKSMLNEVVVTGVSKATLIRENPIPVLSISTKAIERTIESNIVDALVKNSPGLNAVKTGPNISKPFIRGLGYNRVLTLYDGIRQEGQQWGDEHGIEIDAYNIDRAEVIKGPSSIMYGSDAMAGVLSFFPAMPQKKDSMLTGKYMSEYQSNNGLIGNGIRLGIYRNKFLFSLRGSARFAKNYRNTRDQWVYNTGFQEKNLSALAGYAGSKGFLHVNVTLYENLQGIPDGSRDSLNNKFTKQISESPFDNINARPVVSDEELRSYQLSPLRQHIQHKRIYGNGHYALGIGDIDALIAFQQSIRREYNHPSDPSQAGLYVRLNTLNYGLRYSLPRIANIEATLGINGMYQMNKNLDGTDFPIPDFNLIDVGGYLFMKYKRGPLTVSGGVRYDLRRLKGDNFYVKKSSQNVFERHALPPDTNGAVLQFPQFNQNFHGISGSVGATYLISEVLSVKANIARGYRAPNIAEIASNGLDPGAKIVYIGNKDFIPEFNFQMDLGLDGRFRNFSWSLSVFNNNIDHYIYLSQLVDADGNAVVIVPGNKTFQYQQASAQLYGFEGAFTYSPETLKGFVFNSSISNVYGYNHKYKKEGLNGEYLPFIPPFKLISGVNQEILVRSAYVRSLTFKGELEFNAAQTRFMALYQTETYTPAYSLINMAANIEFKYGKRSFPSLQFQINNVFNTVYQSNLSRLKYFGIYGMGRNACIRLVIPF